MNIQNSIVFITGANRGLGLAFAQEALRRGASKVYAGVRTLTDTAIPGVVQVLIDVTDPASIAAAAARCADTTLLVNNAGIGRLTASTLDGEIMETMREIFETNLFGVIRVTQAFAPVLASNGGGSIINVLSDASWLARPMLAAYSASKAAAWSYTNSSRIELRAQHTNVLGLHAGFIDTDMTSGFDMEKSTPQQVASVTLAGLESSLEEVLADDVTRQVKASLSAAAPLYLNPPEVA